MSLLQVVRLVPSPTFYDATAEARRRPFLPIGAIAGWQDELAFAALRLAYSASGGIARGDDVDRLLMQHGPDSFIGVARLLEDEAIFGFEWKGSTWIPMFQFGPGNLSLRTLPRRVRAELGDEFDGWTVSAWFVEPNLWLTLQRPIDLLESDIDAVMLAARADRFVAAG